MNIARYIVLLWVYIHDKHHFKRRKNHDPLAGWKDEILRMTLFRGSLQKFAQQASWLASGWMLPQAHTNTHTHTTMIITMMMMMIENKHSNVNVNVNFDSNVIVNLNTISNVNANQPMEMRIRMRMSLRIRLRFVHKKNEKYKHNSSMCVFVPLWAAWTPLACFFVGLAIGDYGVCVCRGNLSVWNEVFGLLCVWCCIIIIISQSSIKVNTMDRKSHQVARRRPQKAQVNLLFVQIPHHGFFSLELSGQLFAVSLNCLV